MWTALAVMAFGMPAASAEEAPPEADGFPADDSTGETESAEAEPAEDGSVSARLLEPLDPGSLADLGGSCGPGDSCVCTFGVRSEDNGSLDINHYDGEIAVPGPGETKAVGWTFVCFNF